MSTRHRPRNPSVTIVVPALNEARNLEAVLPMLPPVHEVIVVDGGSTDDTLETVARVLPGARVIQQTRRGKGNALVCGFEMATGDIIVMFDADGSADPDEVPDFIAALATGADFAKGTRIGEAAGSEDITQVRNAGNRALTALTNVAFRTRFTDLCYGYNAFWRDVLPLLELPSMLPAGDAMLWGDGFEIETVLNCRVAMAGLVVVEVASVERSRVHGVSNLHAVRDGVRVLGTIVTECSTWRQKLRGRGAASAAAMPSRSAVAVHARPDVGVVVPTDLGGSIRRPRTRRETGSWLQIYDAAAPVGAGANLRDSA